MADTNDWYILVVEDEPDGREVVAGMLEFFNIATDPVGSAEEAIERLSSNQYSGAVIDLALPGMDGWTLLNAIRSDPRLSNLPCVAITAYHSSGVRQQAMEAGFNAYFPKPLDDTSFVRELSRVIANR